MKLRGQLLASTLPQCPLLCEIGVGSEDGFDCTYEQWAEHFREQVRQAAQEEAQQAPAPAVVSDRDIDLAERLHQAQTTGLEDGTRIEARGVGWVVVDSFQSFLVDPDDAAWVVDEDDEDMPPAVFATAEVAYRAWERSQEVAGARAPCRILRVGE